MFFESSDRLCQLPHSVKCHKKTLLGLNSWEKYPSLHREREIRRCLYTWMIKHEIRHFTITGRFLARRLVTIYVPDHTDHRNNWMVTQFVFLFLAWAIVRACPGNFNGNGRQNSECCCRNGVKSSKLCSKTTVKPLAWAHGYTWVLNILTTFL